MKQARFYTFVGIFVVTAVVTLLGGVTKRISIKEFYLRTLLTALIVELVGAVIVLFGRTDFFAKDQPKRPNVIIAARVFQEERLAASGVFLSASMQPNRQNISRHLFVSLHLRQTI
jgi:hypothetical protein